MKIRNKFGTKCALSVTACNVELYVAGITCFGCCLSCPVLKSTVKKHSFFGSSRSGPKALRPYRVWDGGGRGGSGNVCRRHCCLCMDFHSITHRRQHLWVLRALLHTGCWEMLRNCFLKLSVVYLCFGARLIKKSSRKIY